jgi:hypothetical protein
MFSLVDDDVFEWAGKINWHVLECENMFYAVRNVGLPDGSRTLSLLHRDILNAGPGEFVDHIDFDGLNNLRQNIRLCSKQQNNRNQRIRKDNTSGYKGVHLKKSSGLWVARIQVGPKRIYLGEFETDADAAKAYNVSATEFFGEFAYINKIP